MIRIRQKLAVRLFHGLNLVALWIMIGSGLQIYAANPVFGGRQGWPGPAIFRLGGWLAGGRHWHFFGMWIFGLNLLAYGIYLLASGHWRKRYPGGKDLRAIRAQAAPQRVNYAWHRLVLAAMILPLLWSLYTGLGMYKPVQLAWILDSVGGDWFALRVAHLLPVLLVPLLLVLHLRQGWRVGGWALLQSIFVDSYRPSLRRSEDP